MSILAALDTRLAAFLPTIIERQEQYRSANGHYFQGLRTHAQPPSDGIDIAPDQVDRKPTDQLYAWSDVGPLPSQMGSSLSIDVYDGPSGKGYVVRLEVDINGTVWQRRWNVGPETWRSHNWRELI